MFYAHFVLSKRGPLAKIWLAAHWEKKLTKAQVYETDIDSTVDAILEPKVKLALRTSGHLLLGVVRIYSRKTKYLLADCNEAFVKIKMAFRPGVVDLPDDNREVAASAITLQENFDDFNANFNDFEMDALEVAPKFAVNQSRPEEITIKEDVGHINFITDDGFGDVGFDDRELMREASSIEDSLFQTPAPLGDASTLTEAQITNKDLTLTDQEAFVANDGFGDNDDGLDADLLGGPGLFEDMPMDAPDISNIEAAPPSLAGDDDTITEMPPPPVLDTTDVTDIPDEAPSGLTAPCSTTIQPTMSDTTLITNEEEAFALEPLDTTSMVTESKESVSGISVDRRPKRRRKLLVDEQKGIDSQSMKEQLIQTNDIVTTLDLAPPTLKLMLWKDSGSVDKLFTNSGRNMPCKALQKLFTRNLAVVNSGSTGNTSTDNDDDKKSKRGRSPSAAAGADDTSTEIERNQTNDESEFALPQIPDVSEVAANDTGIPEEPSALDDLPPEESQQPEPEQQAEQEEEQVEETPRKRQKLDRASKAADKSTNSKHDKSNSTNNTTSAASAEIDEIDSADEMEAPTLEEQENTIVAEESTGDEVEDKRLNRRTHAMLTTLQRHFDKGDDVSLLDMIRRNHNRKQAAAKFYTCLVLQKHNMVSVEQSEPFADIMMSRGSNFAARAAA